MKPASCVAAAGDRGVIGFSGWLGIGTVILSALSIWLIGVNARTEPFPRFLAAEALLHIGGGSILITGWMVAISAVIYGIVKRRVSAGWSLILVWAAIVLCYLQFVPRGYISDVSSWVQGISSR